MSRHNRRRNRGGHKTSSNLSIHQRSFDADSKPSLEPPDISRISSHRNSLDRPVGISARHWHNRYQAWQARERRQREESTRLEAEKRRIFGDDDGSGEDDGLCVKMLEYFGGLDFIDG